METSKKIYLRKVVSSTIHLITVSDLNDYEIRGSGSACIIRYRDKKILLTVRHVVNEENTEEHLIPCINSGKISENNRGIVLYPLTKIHFIENWSFSLLKNDIEEGYIDFCFSILDNDFEVIQNEMLFDEFNIKEGQKTLIDTSLIHIPDRNLIHAFGGGVKHFIDPFFQDISWSPMLYDGLRFIEKIGHCYSFDTINSKMKKEDFIGTSGAPIFDSRGNLVSLVKSGSPDAKILYGIALPDFKSFIDCVIDNE